MIHNFEDDVILLLPNKKLRTTESVMKHELSHWRRSDVFIVNFEHVTASWESFFFNGKRVTSSPYMKTKVN